MSTPIEPTRIVEALQWRYAVKKFDSTREIDPAIWETIEEALVLTPSSYGLQPWKFLVISDRIIRAELVKHSWGQKQVLDCAKLVVLAVRRQMTAVEIDQHIVRTAEVRGVPVERLEGFRKMMIGDIVSGARSDTSLEWASMQSYIALGNLMTTCALLGVDTCPMEGFEPAKYDEILGLEGTGLTTAVLCCVGHRATDDGYAGSPKVRFLRSVVVEHR